MELLFHPGDYTAKFDWNHIHFFFKKTEGMLTIPIGMWYRADDNKWSVVVGRKSILSKAHVCIKLYPSVLHIGQFLIVAHVQTIKTSTALPLGHIYNNRKYHYKIEKKKRAWNVTLNNRTVSISTHRTPTITLNMLPNLHKDKTYGKEIIITLENAQDIQSTDKNS